jgi:hypothetical protein
MSNASKEIVTISVPNGQLDNDYTFFEDGKIRHNYDQSIYKSNLEAWLNAGNITDAEKAKILKECPLEFKAKVTALLKK